MVKRFSIKKATFANIDAILDKENFIYIKKDVENLLKGNQKGVRYGNAVLNRREGGVRKKRFVKILLDGNPKTYRLFCRQVKITSAFHEARRFDGPTMAVVNAKMDGPVPYAIFEAREDGSTFGFYSDTAEGYKAFTKSDIHRLAKVVYSFHQSGLSFDKSSLRLAPTVPSSLRYSANECERFLRKKILHQYPDGSEARSTVEKLLEHYTKIPDIRKRILKIFRENWKYIDSAKIAQKFYLIHSDLQIDNVYKHRDGRIELLDFEWVSKTDNAALAIMHDYGNFRARAWFSLSFQSSFDKAMYDVGVALYKNPKMIAAALKLGIIRSSVMMSRYHLDAANTLRNEKKTKGRYRAMYSAVIANLAQAINKKKAPWS